MAAKKTTKTKAVRKSSTKNLPAVIPDNEGLPENMNVNPQNLIMQAINQKVPVEVLERLLAMRKSLQEEQAKIAFREAMSNFQAECPIINKSSKVDYQSKKGSRVNYRYATLDVIVVQVRNSLRNNGLSYTFTSQQTETTYTSICHNHHIMGHSESSSFTIPIDPEWFMNDAQKTGAARSYANRYAFCNAYGILTGDDDDDTNSIEPEDIPPTQDVAVGTSKQSGMKGCPLCGAAAIIKSKYPDCAFVCWDKPGGCGQKFDAEMNPIMSEKKTSTQTSKTTNGTSKAVDTIINGKLKGDFHMLEIIIKSTSTLEALQKVEKQIVTRTWTGDEAAKIEILLAEKKEQITLEGIPM